MGHFFTWRPSSLCPSVPLPQDDIASKAPQIVLRTRLPRLPFLRPPLFSVSLLQLSASGKKRPPTVRSYSGSWQGKASTIPSYRFLLSLCSPAPFLRSGSGPPPSLSVGYGKSSADGGKITAAMGLAVRTPVPSVRQLQCAPLHCMAPLSLSLPPRPPRESI